jgi:hypothetical protein
LVRLLGELGVNKCPITKSIVVISSYLASNSNLGDDYDEKCEFCITCLSIGLFYCCWNHNPLFLTISWPSVEIIKALEERHLQSMIYSIR